MAGRGAGDAPLLRHLAVQADACTAMGSPLYARLLHACIDDLEAAGPLLDVLGKHLQAPGPAATGLRLLGGVHHAVLTGRAPRLARQYPSVGGTPDDDLVPAFLDAATRYPDELRGFLAHPPQTNAVGRSGALVGGVLRLLEGRDLPVRVHEIGSSAGLLLHADRYRYRVGTTGAWWGPPASPLAFEDAWRGRAPDVQAPLHVVERSGSDVAPVDLAADGAGDRLLAYVWADQVDRVEQTRGAIAVAAEHPVPVERLDAVSAVDRLELRQGHLTVLWHSVMWQYLARGDQQAVTASLERLGATADREAPLVRLSLEPQRPAPGKPHRFLVGATSWPGGTTTVLGRSAGHGLPTTWSEGARPTLG